MDNLANIGVEQGIFVILFVAILRYTLKRMERQAEEQQKITAKREEASDKRELRYIKTIEGLTLVLNKVDMIATDISEIKEHIYNKAVQ